MEHLAERLAEIPGVVAVALGGSRARGEERPDSDWDFGLYYRGQIRADHVRALDCEGTVVEPGEWGRLVNGGAWLTIDEVRVDLLYRDLEQLEHWTAEAEEGRFEIDLVEGFVAGMPTYALAGELALARVVVGELPRPLLPAGAARFCATPMVGQRRVLARGRGGRGRPCRHGRLQRPLGPRGDRSGARAAGRARRVGAERERDCPASGYRTCRGDPGRDRLESV